MVPCPARWFIAFLVTILTLLVRLRFSRHLVFTHTKVYSQEKSKVMQNSIRHFNSFANEYDKLSKEHHWYAPEALFGLTYEYQNPQEKLLDIGIGTGQSSLLQYKAGLEIYGVDGSKTMLAECMKKGIAKDLKQCDLMTVSHLPFSDKTFNHIVACGVLYFFSDLEKFFKEARRLLLPKGTFGFNVEDPKTGYDLNYVNYDNDAMTDRIIDKVGVPVFRHPEYYIKELAQKYGFQISRTFQYLAYTSPTENKDIFFKQYVLQ